MASAAMPLPNVARTKSLRKAHSMPHMGAVATVAAVAAATSPSRRCTARPNETHSTGGSSSGYGPSKVCSASSGSCATDGARPAHHRAAAACDGHHQPQRRQPHTGGGSCNLLDQIGNTRAIQHSDVVLTPEQQRNAERDRRIRDMYRLAQQQHQQQQQQQASADGRQPPPPQQQQPRSAPYRLRMHLEQQQMVTLRTHYYPEGGWGWVLVGVCFAVQMITHGLHLALGVFALHVAREFGVGFGAAVALTAVSFAVGLAGSPVTVSLCKRKSTRLVAVIGGLVAALGCLFTSFAAQLHQVVFSFGVLVGLGVNVTRDCSTVMVAQYFKRRREVVEQYVVAGSGAGVAVMAVFYEVALGAAGWRYGLQAIAATVFVTFILGLFYRSASLYHPQRRAILHLKNQRRKVKDKNKQSTRAPFFDFSTLQSKTVRILLTATATTSLGLYVPLFLLPHSAQLDGCTGQQVLYVMAALGGGWMLGSVANGQLVLRWSASRRCFVERQYQVQGAAVLAGLAQLTLAAVGCRMARAEGWPVLGTYVLFGGVYGFACGAWHYAMKVYTYERVRARNFARAWSFVQCSQALPVAVGVPLAAWLDGPQSSLRAGYVWGGVCSLLGGALLVFIDLHKRRVKRQQIRQRLERRKERGMQRSETGGDFRAAALFGVRLAPGASKEGRLPVSAAAVPLRRLSFSNEPANDAPFPYSTGALLLALDGVDGEDGGDLVVTSGSTTTAAAVGAASVTATALMLNSELLLGHMGDELVGDLNTAAAAAAVAAAAAAAAAAALDDDDDEDDDDDKAELTCISEEGIADMDLPDNLFDDYDYIGDCITSCNKVENYLMQSEFENNLNVELPSSVHSVQTARGHAPCPNAMCMNANNG